MLTETRQEEILRMLEQKGSVTVQELKDVFGASESTIRRDLNVLHKKGALIKVFGGAVQTESRINTREEEVALRKEQSREEKLRIARYAASLIEPDDFIYLDAGTTTGYMIEYVTERTATFVTNAVSHAQRLAALDFRVLLIGGELKGTTEAVVGNQAILSLQSFHFTKGFFGTNGVSRKSGYTTPDCNEALVKKTALEQSAKRYILADTAKFGNISSVTFAPFDSADVLTDQHPPEAFTGCKNIIVIS